LPDSSAVSTLPHVSLPRQQHSFGFIVGGGKYFIIFALIVTALSNVTLIRDNAHKYVKDSMLYPLLLKAGSAIIKIDPATLGLTTPHTTSVTQKNDSNQSNGKQP